jgi:hypothetical protein
MSKQTKQVSKSVKNNTKVQVQKQEEHIESEVEEIEEEEVQETEEEIEESEEEQESEEEVQASDENKERKKQKKQTTRELYSEINTRFSLLTQLENDVNEQEKVYEKITKESNALRKKYIKEIEANLKKFEKTFSSEIGKPKKPRKTENAGKGGFNKQDVIPPLLRDYIGIKGDELMSRPAVTKLLNHKFTESNLMKVKTNENGKEIKVIVLDFPRS